MNMASRTFIGMALAAYMMLGIGITYFMLTI